STPTYPSTPSYPVYPSTPSNNGGTVISVPRQSDPNGYVDLRVRVVRTGNVDRNTAAFYQTATPSQSGRIGVEFIIENLGTKTSPGYTFTASMPGNNNYQSQYQQPLAPGQQIVNT